jgi:hypothetical protein
MDLGMVVQKSKMYETATKPRGKYKKIWYLFSLNIQE